MKSYRQIRKFLWFSGRLAWLALAAILLLALLQPISNPDLFWHLSAARWMVEHRALPRSDFLSFTAPGAAWIDFEWLSQLIFLGLYALGGMVALWLIKALLMAMALGLTVITLRLNSMPNFYLAAATGLWCSAQAAHSDIRPELFSLVLFALLLYRLEKLRLGQALSWPTQLALVPGFAIWTNCHGGFALGLMLLALYAVGEGFSGRAANVRSLLLALVLATIGTLCNPSGLGPYRVAWRHIDEGAMLARYIEEWMPLMLWHPMYWSVWLTMGLVVVAILVRWWRAGLHALPWSPLLATLYLGVATLVHNRISVYFPPVALILIGSIASPAGWLETRTVRRGVRALGFLGTAWIAWLLPHIYWGGVFHDRYIPPQAAEFMARERRVLESLRIFNLWEQGGYLGWRLRPWYRVYCDGRYLFHDQLAEMDGAQKDLGNWRALLDGKQLSGALIPLFDVHFETVRSYPDGTTRPFQRPWYHLLMARERWALVYWDPKSLLFVERKSVPKDWLSAHEYLYFRPLDEPAMAEELRLGEVSTAEVEAERARHQRELSLPIVYGGKLD